MLQAEVGPLERVAFVVVALVVGGVIGGLFSWFRHMPGPFSTIAAGVLGAVSGLLVGFMFAAYLVTRSSSGIGAVSLGLGELSVVLVLIGFLGAGVFVHLLFAHVPFLSGAQRLAPVVAGAVGCAAVVLLFQWPGPV